VLLFTAGDADRSGKRRHLEADEVAACPVGGFIAPHRRPAGKDGSGERGSQACSHWLDEGEATGIWCSGRRRRRSLVPAPWSVERESERERERVAGWRLDFEGGGRYAGCRGLESRDRARGNERERQAVGAGSRSKGRWVGPKHLLEWELGLLVNESGNTDGNIPVKKQDPRIGSRK
jgi:hypothetical protein